MALIGAAPLTVCRTASQGYVQVPLGCPAPEDILTEDAERLIEEGYLAEVDLPGLDAAETGLSDKVKDILARVGDDPVLAAEALEREQAKAADDVRPTLVEKLEAIVLAGV